MQNSECRLANAGSAPGSLPKVAPRSAFCILHSSFCILFALSCSPAASDPLAALFADSTAWIDLSHPFDSATIYWPTARPFTLQRVTAGMTPAGYYYEANDFRAAEHGGTHVDAPIHFAQGKHTVDRIPLTRLVGPAVVVDVAAAAAADRDYLIGVHDLQAFEAAHGRIVAGAIVLFRTAWAARWPNPAAYLGTGLRGPGAVPLLHFPGLDPQAARWLTTERTVDAVGIDTPSIDYGQSARFEAHQILFAANVPAFENLANLDRLPPVGAYVVALPMKIAGGSGAPVRIVGIVPGGSRAGGR
jgi:kynurenine formamidase